MRNLKVNLVGLKRQHRPLKPLLSKVISEVLESGKYILGDNVKALEEEIAAFCGTRYGVGVASGTDALMLALKSAGIGEGDEVITSPFTFIGTTEAIRHSGGKIVFADIDINTYGIDPAQVRKKITRRTRAIMPVHLYGYPCDMGSLNLLAREYNLKIIEDCAHAIGAEYKGKKAGSFGDAGCISFFPTKNLGGCGDGGIVVTNDADVAEKVRLLRAHGSRIKYRHMIDGYNSRLDEVQAAILRVKLKNIDAWNDQRRAWAFLYNQLLDKAKKKGLVLPYAAESSRHIYHIYAVRYRNRDKLIHYLNKKSIEVGLHYPLPLHLQSANKDLGYKKGEFPQSEIAARQVIALPLYPELKKSEVTYVASMINHFIS